MKTTEQKLNEIERQQEVRLNELKRKSIDGEKRLESYFEKQQGIFDFMYNKLSDLDKMKVDKQVKEMKVILN